MSFHVVNRTDNPVETLIKLSRSTLIIPTISIGNIPQLATDLLIHNLKCDKIARLDDDLLYPFISPVDYVEGEQSQQDGINTALEIYLNLDLKISVLQQRSPILPGQQTNFLNKILIPFIKNTEFTQVLVLNSVAPTSGVSSLEMPRFSFYSNNLSDLFKTLLTNEDDYSIKSIEDFTQLKNPFIDHLFKNLVGENFTSVQLSETPSNLNLYKTLKDKFPTSLPLSRDASTISLNDDKTQFMILSIEGYEGDNTPDLINLANFTILKILQLTFEQKSLKTPKSWQGFYGNRDIPIGIDGLYS